MEFCIATVVTMIKNVLFEQISDEDLVNLLISDMVIELNLTTKKGDPYYMDKRQVSKLMNNKINVPTVLRNALSKDAASVDRLEAYFLKVLMPRIIPEKEAILCNDFIMSISNYDGVSVETLSEIRQYADEKKTARLTALVVRMALATPNKIIMLTSKKKKSEVIADRRHPIKDTEVSTNNDIYCLQAVFEAYRSKTGMLQGFSLDDLPQFKRHFQRQKEAYFAAEAVRHASRDAFLDEEDPFSDLLDESYDGIIETWEKHYTDGFERMEAVLSQAVQISMESNLISRETAWVTVRVKKGLCHVLVNERRIEGWVYDENI